MRDSLARIDFFAGHDYALWRRFVCTEIGKKFANLMIKAEAGISKYFSRSFLRRVRLEKGWPRHFQNVTQRRKNFRKCHGASSEKIAGGMPVRIRIGFRMSLPRAVRSISTRSLTRGFQRQWTIMRCMVFRFSLKTLSRSRFLGKSFNLMENLLSSSNALTT